VKKALDILYGVKFFSVPLIIHLLTWGSLLGFPTIVWLLGGLKSPSMLVLGGGLAFSLTITDIYENKVLGLEWPFKL